MCQMKGQFEALQDRLDRWRRTLHLLESGKMYFGTAQSGSADWKDATKERIEELKADIAAVEFAIREL